MSFTFTSPIHVLDVASVYNVAVRSLIDLQQPDVGSVINGFDLDPPQIVLQLCQRKRERARSRP
jgi:hypothetical protein